MFGFVLFESNHRVTVLTPIQRKASVHAIISAIASMVAMSVSAFHIPAGKSGNAIVSTSPVGATQILGMITQDAQATV